MSWVMITKIITLMIIMINLNFIFILLLELGIRGESCRKWTSRGEAPMRLPFNHHQQQQQKKFGNWIKCGNNCWISDSGQGGAWWLFCERLSEKPGKVPIPLNAILYQVYNNGDANCERIGMNGASEKLCKFDESERSKLCNFINAFHKGETYSLRFHPKQGQQPNCIV